jgi:hypothetical protein
VTGRARERGLWRLGLWNPRDFTTDNYRTVDDRPYGGGPGMVMMAGPLAQAIDAARAAQQAGGCASTRTIYLSPAGKPLTHGRVIELATTVDAGYVLLAGRYEGVDERLVEGLDEEIAIGAAAIEEDAGVVVLGEQSAGQLQRAAAAQPDVDDDDIGAAAVDELVGVVDVLGDADHAEALAAEQQLHALAQRAVVLDQHHRGGSGDGEGRGAEVGRDGGQ